MKLRFHSPLSPNKKKIVSVLDTASALVEKQKSILEKYDLFLKSKFIEMFGDPVKNPMGWEVKGFLDILNLTTGKLDSNASEENGIYPFFTCAQETFTINTYAFDCEALLLAGNNAAGVYSIKHYNGKFNAYQRTYVLTLKDTKNQYEFFKMLLETKLLELQNVSIGTNTKYLTLGILKNINMYIPEQKLQVEFSKIVKQTEILKQKEQQKLEKLQTLYDAFMKRAFDGEIR
jgi:type I restriction enzyme S subunit